MTQNIKRTRIFYHNIHQQTDKLYNPLRETLRECSQPKSRAGRASSMYDLRGSQISNKIIELSPEQADYMMNTILIPADKALKSTEKLQRVEDKKFIAIGVNAWENPTISEHQFQEKQKQTNLEMKQIVYEMQQNEKSRMSKIEESPMKSEIEKLYETNITKNILVSKSKIQNSIIREQVNSRITSSSKSKSKKLSIVSSIKDPETSRIPSKIEDIKKYENQYGLSSGKYIKIQPNKSKMKKISQISTPSYVGTPKQANKAQQSTKTPVNNLKYQRQRISYHPIQTSQFTLNQITGTQQHKNELIIGDSPNHYVGYQSYYALNQYGNANIKLPQNAAHNIQKFTFGTHNLHINTTIANKYPEQRPRYGRSKSQYQYNLFSSLDHAVNSKCQLCKKNEIIASRPLQSWQ